MVKHERYTNGDCYRGTQAELIAAGIAKAEWFPSAPVALAGRPGRIQRSFDIEGVCSIRQEQPYSRGQWFVRIPCDQAEQARREEQEDIERQRVQADKEAREETAKQARIAAAIKALPPFVPGSMTEGEKHHMRVLRGLHDLHYDMVTDLAERLLGNTDEVAAVMAQAKPKAEAKPGLRLVVNNEGGQ